MEDDKSLAEFMQAEENNGTASATINHGWQKVTYAKKNRKNHASKTASDSSKVNGSAIPADKSSVFKGLEKHAEERRRQLAAQRAATVYDDEDDKPVRSKRSNRLDDDEDEEFSSDAKENNAAEVNKKEKPKKVKKPKVTVAEAAKKIDADDLVVFLANVTESYEGQQDIQLMRFADYFGRAFSGVSASQFPWLKLFRESAVAKIADVPVSYISDVVYKTSVDWINQRSYEALGTFVLWALDSVLADLAAQNPGSKGLKKGGQPPPLKCQVAIFLVLAMVLRRKPDVLVNIVPNLRDNVKYQGQDKLPVIVWMIVQACQGDLAVGLYLWAHLVLPILGGKAGSNPQSRDLVLQLVERILAAPKARSILVNSAVRKGERLMPPAALDMLLHVTFPATSARVKATERFEVIYPLLKEVSLAGSPGSKAMKQVSQQIQTLAVKAAAEGIPALSQEAVGIFVWTLTQNPDCYKQWDKIYVDNIEVSVAALKKLAENWKELSTKQSSPQGLAETLKSFRQKNEKALSGGDDSRQASFKEADKHCRTLLGRLSSGSGCMKTLVILAAAVAVGVAVVSQNPDGFDWDKLSSMFDSEKLSAMFDAEKLSAMFDVEKLSAMFDVEKLSAMFKQ